jgi:uncharacterized protein (UPF0332 family)
VFDWGDFLVLAEILARDPTNEAAQRSAISRAYYATFHAGRDYLVRSGIPLNRGRNTHWQVQYELRKTSERLGFDVERLHEWRKSADYDNPSFEDVAGQATVAVNLAGQTIEAIQAIP